ncbi:glucosamine-6-phosphate deaminase [Halolactibacillus halophilus]|uniref:Glucosamine-6-phosphate deaminase n=1 Tax=Halolactibacillus halophilus TaxID=306540 RepID=A0A1I5P000_9BACI|nr:glucosamine-6-phosphate deaminase [Halolactibacillus halophilus]GEM01554.1 glucosamine-6-phosphate deaminase 1 [Halolactibacillus halophilus]SFP27438.1 glucosamine-6-phosphate deaminase [Halolactibacillus halophilus]
MNIIVCQNYDHLSDYAKDVVIDTIKTKDKPVLGLATGSTPEGMYRALIKAHQNNDVSFKHVTSFNLDEYIGLGKDDPNSYHHFMDEHLFNHVDIDQNETFVPPGNTDDHEKACRDYEQNMHHHDNLDLQVLGLGINGHIGFNEPGTPFDTRTHMIELDDSTREANARFFDSIDDVPTHAITMGIETIMESKQILLLASGDSKKEAVYRLLNGEETPDFPASILHRHKNVTVILDRDAASLLSVEQIDQVVGPK